MRRTRCTWATENGEPISRYEKHRLRGRNAAPKPIDEENRQYNEMVNDDVPGRLPHHHSHVHYPPERPRSETSEHDEAQQPSAPAERSHGQQF